MEFCPRIYMITPFTTVLSLGTLPQGNYEIYVMDEKGNNVFMENLPINAAKKAGSVDNYTYAQVDEIQVLKASATNTLPIVLKGTLNNSCLSLKEVKVALTAGNVYDVLPILNVSESNCEAVNTPYSTTVYLKNFPVAPTLINVRSMGGQSIERVVDANSNSKN